VTHGRAVRSRRDTFTRDPITRLRGGPSRRPRAPPVVAGRHSSLSRRDREAGRRRDGRPHVRSLDQESDRRASVVAQTARDLGRLRAQALGRRRRRRPRRVRAHLLPDARSTWRRAGACRTGRVRASVGRVPCRSPHRRSSRTEPCRRLVFCLDLRLGLQPKPFIQR